MALLDASTELMSLSDTVDEMRPHSLQIAIFTFHRYSTLQVEITKRQICDVEEILGCKWLKVLAIN